MKLALAIMSASALLAAGCGGSEPLSRVNRNPQLSLPVTSDPATNIVSVIRYSQATGGARDGIDLNLLTVSQSVLAPAAGIVSGIDPTPGAAAVYIFHGPRLTTRISQLQAVTVQPGSMTEVGSVLGLASSTGALPVHFSVIYDGAFVCPQSFLSAAAQNVLFVRSGGASLCE